MAQGHPRWGDARRIWWKVRRGKHRSGQNPVNDPGDRLRCERAKQASATLARCPAAYRRAMRERAGRPWSA